MGRRGRRAAKDRTGRDSDSEDSGDDGADGAAEGVPEVLTGEQLTDKLSECLDVLTEKRASIREENTKIIAAALAKDVQYDWVANNIETLTVVLLQNLRREKSAGEMEVSARTFALACLTYGMELESRGPELIETLTGYASKTQKPKLRQHAWDLLAVVAFVTVQDMPVLKSLMEDAVAASQDPNVAHAALGAWGVIASKLDNLESELRAALPVFARLLGSSDPDVRIAAGENIALLFEGVDEDMEAGDAQRRIAQVVDDGVDVDALIESLKTLSVENTRYKNKRELSNQRSYFRDIYRAVKDGANPDLLIKVGSESVTLDSWWLVKQYNLFKGFFKGGFQAHCRGNDFVREVLDFQLEEFSEGMNALQKRAYMSPNSAAAKDRTVTRGSARRKHHRYRRPSHFDSDPE